MFIFSASSLLFPPLTSINKKNNTQRTWPSKTVIYSAFHNTVWQTNRQAIKTAIDVFNFVYYSFVLSMRPHIMSVADLELNYIHTLLTFPWYTKQTAECRAWHLHYLFVQHKLNHFFFLLLEHWHAVEISYIRQIDFIIQASAS